MNEPLAELIIPISFLAIGAFSELITMKNPSPGERIGTIIAVLVFAAVGFAFPPEWALPVILGFLVAKSGRITGFILSFVIDKTRLILDNHVKA